jgi:hypothetical protein
MYVGFGAYGPMPLTKSPVPDAKTDDDPELLEIESQVPPNELEGYQMIWQVATESTNKSVIDQAAKLLVQMHHEVKSELRPLITTFDDLFIEQCFTIIES